MHKVPYFFLVFNFLFQTHLYSQNTKIDSLILLLDDVEQGEKALIFNQLSKLYYYENPQQTIDYGNQALIIANEFENKEEQYYALVNIGVGYSLLGDNREPIKYHKQALSIAEELSDENKLSNIYNELGIDYKYDGDFEKAIEFLLKSLAAKETLLLKNNTHKNKKSIANALNNIGVVYDDMGFYDKALEYYQKALKIRREIDDKKGLASVLHNIGIIYEEKGKFEKSLEYYLQSLSIKEKFSSKRSIAITIGNIGIIYLDLGEYEKALEYHKKALTTYREVEDQRAESNILNSIADIYLEMKQPSKAYPYIIEAMEIAKEIDSKSNLVNSYKFLAAYYSDTKNYQKAYMVQQDLINLNDSMYTLEMTESIAEMQTKYETQKKEQEIQLLTKDKKIQTLKLKKQRTQFWLLAGSIMFFLIVAYFVFTSYRLRQKNYRTALEKKNLETEQRMLRSQMNPHFIFNSMNSIQSYISGNDNFNAMTYLSKFAQLMRGILENSRKTMISLEEEINTLKLYIELERLRFKNKFEFKLEIDPELYPETTYIPPMLAQPFVENAIKHGLKSKDGNGKLHIGFKKKNQLIECTIEDNGIGREQANALNENRNKDHQSLGMQVTNERIIGFKNEKNTKSSLTIVDLKDNEGKASGTLVNVLFPYEEE